jgi:hypothetical protein
MKKDASTHVGPDNVVLSTEEDALEQPEFILTSLCHFRAMQVGIPWLVVILH